MNKKQNKRKKRDNRTRLIVAIGMCVFLIIVLSLMLLFIFMAGGVIVEQGDPEEVFGNPQEERTKQFLRVFER